MLDTDEMLSCYILKREGALQVFLSGMHSSFEHLLWHEQLFNLIDRSNCTFTSGKGYCTSYKLKAI